MRFLYWSRNEIFKEYGVIPNVEKRDLLLEVRVLFVTKYLFHSVPAEGFGWSYETAHGALRLLSLVLVRILRSIAAAPTCSSVIPSHRRVAQDIGRGDQPDKVVAIEHPQATDPSFAMSCTALPIGESSSTGITR